jgi:hypothetical protein
MRGREVGFFDVTHRDTRIIFVAECRPELGTRTENLTFGSARYLRHRTRGAMSNVLARVRTGR